ncbi:hypothetical protein GGI03_000444 [Coemansia sp. RSA 2337]|nr:hypothetical protein LPJ71_000629 [Coemansia sp. S17]KAJ2018186.1 hypothetical protein GGI14_002474 [Coemansia sp. S680]KAJ2068484.1 hypothetical protein GGH13_004889 [Coemansia sp. S155-1]KAJ2110264.1 hypothetical protein GGI16_000370 [Coemansia sp. S142-1]KAJ2334458.1 hypothetical protein GGH92_008317 [Coemansia sp. RSA 2673]KAJ2469322.1 hypothetical protein GGI03_000444 [Coemansia sp. RSA 2337]
MATKRSDKAAEGFIDAANASLQMLTADIRGCAQTAASELVSVIDGCQYSTEAQLSTMLSLLQKTQAAVSVNKDLLIDSKEAIRNCLDNQSATTQSIKETTALAGETLHTIETSKNPADEKKSKYVEEMNRRNDKFEERLRTDHEEFRRMHARRLTSVLQQTQL